MPLFPCCLAHSRNALVARVLNLILLHEFRHEDEEGRGRALGLAARGGLLALAGDATSSEPEHCRRTCAPSCFGSSRVAVATAKYMSALFRRLSRVVETAVGPLPRPSAPRAPWAASASPRGLGPWARRGPPKAIFRGSARGEGATS